MNAHPSHENGPCREDLLALREQLHLLDAHLDHWIHALERARDESARHTASTPAPAAHATPAHDAREHKVA